MTQVQASSFLGLAIFAPSRILAVVCISSSDRDYAGLKELFVKVKPKAGHGLLTFNPSTQEVGQAHVYKLSAY